MTQPPQQDIRNFTAFQTLYMSFYSRDLFQDIARNRKGLYLPYLLFILMLYWVPEMMNMHRDFSGFIADEAPAYVEQVPEITISGGRASIREPVPYYIYDRKKKIPVAIIDTSGEVMSLNNTQATVLLTGSSLVIKGGDEVRAIALTDFGDMVVTKKLAYSWLEVFNNLFILVLFPIVLLISFGFHFLQVILLSFLGGNFSKYFSLDLDFRALVRLSVVAFTPAVLLEAAHAVLDIAYPYSTFLSFLIAAGYLFYAVASNSDRMTLPVGKI